MPVCTCPYKKLELTQVTHGSKICEKFAEMNISKMHHIVDLTIAPTVKLRVESISGIVFRVFYTILVKNGPCADDFDLLYVLLLVGTSTDEQFIF